MTKAEIRNTTRFTAPTGQEYVLIGVEDCVNKRGYPTKIRRWVFRCADCGTETVTTSTRAQLPETRRCPDHRAPGQRVSLNRR